MPSISCRCSGHGPRLVGLLEVPRSWRWRRDYVLGTSAVQGDRGADFRAHRYRLPLVVGAARRLICSSRSRCRLLMAPTSMPSTAPPDRAILSARHFDRRRAPAGIRQHSASGWVDTPRDLGRRRSRPAARRCNRRRAAKDVASIGITTSARHAGGDRANGEPLGRAIVWQDRRRPSCARAEGRRRRADDRGAPPPARSLFSATKSSCPD